MRGHVADDSGYTLIELLVAAALLVVLSALTCSILMDARTAIDVSGERADLHQRGRVAVEAIASAIRDAGAGSVRGTASGPLVRWLPPVWPGRRNHTDGALGLTTIRVLPQVAPATLRFEAPPDATTLDFDRPAACTPPCGFFDRMTIVLLDGLGNFDLFVLLQTDGASATVRRLPGGTGATYLSGTVVLPADVRTLYWNPATRELRSDGGDHSDFPVVNDIVDLAFEYFGDPLPPTEPRPPDGVENCLYDSAGALRAGRQVLDRAGGTLAVLHASAFEDGPWCGSGAEPFDADLLRIRAIDVTVRLQIGNVLYRGADARWFRNPGLATEGARTVRDLVVRTSIAPRNLGGWR
jgi:prepilin-type N-terminal cleavage/methylation domain-containing protein